MTPTDSQSDLRSAESHVRKKVKVYVGSATCIAVVLIVAVTLAATTPWSSNPVHGKQSVPYLGVYEPDAPTTYTEVNQLAQEIGRQPNLVPYYSHWLDPFNTAFAASAAAHGATTIVQIDPKNVSLASIAAGRFDNYLRSYAAAVKAFRTTVVLSFGHEMNGSWYSWADQHTPANVFVAAWRHIVTIFRMARAENVIWLWTVNVVDKAGPIIPDPASWWPGSSYVTWVGIDGYYYTKSQGFAQLFGPTIVDVRRLTNDPIIIAETGASLAADQSAKVTDLFAGAEAYGLLGFVWFDADDTTQGLDWRLRGQDALSTLRQDARSFMTPPSAATPPLPPASQASS
jgi:mannan endo-1,4-beta-mannosidase